MLFILVSLANLAYCGNIYWANANDADMSKKNCADVRITSEEYPHHVELVSKKNEKSSDWETCWSDKISTNKLEYHFQGDTPRCKYYAFRLNEEACSHYTKSMYLSSEGKWMDPCAAQSEIENDKEEGKKNSKNSAFSFITSGALLAFAASLLIL